MPSASPKQENFMGMCASSEGRKAAKKECPPKKVAKEFAKADKRKRESVKHRGKRYHFK